MSINRCQPRDNCRYERARNLLRESLELLNLASSSIFGLSGITTTIVVEHRVAGDPFLLTQRTVILAVNLGDGELVAHLAAKVRPVRGELLAVSAPALGLVDIN